MKSIVVFAAMLSLVLANEGCYKTTSDYCDTKNTDADFANQDCSAVYGPLKQDTLKKELTSVTKRMLRDSYYYLLFGAYFNSYNTHREGFHKLANKLSDETWEDALKMIKHTYQRGWDIDVSMDTSTTTVRREPPKSTINIELLSEIQFLSSALAKKKKVAEEIFKLDKHDHKDQEMVSFLENNYVHHDAQWVRNLAGHVNTMKSFTNDKGTIALAIEMFDNYLEKLY